MIEIPLINGGKITVSTQQHSIDDIYWRSLNIKFIQGTPANNEVITKMILNSIGPDDVRALAEALDQMADELEA